MADDQGKAQTGPATAGSQATVKGDITVADKQSRAGGVLGDITQHLAAIFRYMLPGVLIVGSARLAYPDWPVVIDLKSWQHLLVLGIVTVALGNAWFALNRYGFHTTC